MDPIYYAFTFLTAVIVGLLADLFVGRPTKEIFRALLSDYAPQAFERLLSIATVAISLLSGFQFITERCGYSKGPYACLSPSRPNALTEWITLGWNTIAASSIGIFTLYGVVMFSCLVLAVGLVRARISGRGE